MMEFTVTGIRYQMGEHLSYEEKDAAATKFVASLEIGQPVVLKFEPDNPGSPNRAIAVYVNYEHIGYISDEQCDLVSPLLDERHLGKGQVVRKDNHVTFFITIPGAPERLTASEPQKRILPESPLGDSFLMPFTKAERTLELVSVELMDMELTKDSIPEIMKLTRLYVPMVKVSICREDNLWRGLILKKLQHLLAEKVELGMSEEVAAELKGLCKQVRDAVGDMHRSKDHWPERVFVDHLERLRNDVKSSGHLFNKYRETFLDGMTFEEADKDKMKNEYKRLCGWLKGLKWSELKKPKNLQAMGYRVNYLGLSRRELYDLFSVLLLIEQIEPLSSDSSADEVIDKLKPIFYNDRTEALKFYKEIQGMKPTQITDRVNKLVSERKISEMSRKRDLWRVLHDCGIYKRTETNWNDQVK